MKTIFTMLLVLLSVLSFSVSAAEYPPSASADVKVFPASMVCGMEASTKGEKAVPKQAGLIVTEGFIMTCSLPFENNRYIERIVLDFTIAGMSPRYCNVGFTRASSGATVNNKMILDSSRSIKSYHYDDLGSESIYTGGYVNNALLVQCMHWNFTNGSSVRYGSIRVDYSAEQ